MPKIHELKTLSEYYDAVERGLKTYELRFDDRGYAVGDLLDLREIKDGKYTGRRKMVEITHILKGFEGLKDGWAVLSIKTFCRGKKQCLKR